MKRALLLLIIILVAATVQGAELSFRDSETDTRITNGIISINFDDQEITRTLDSNGTVSIDIEDKKVIELTLDLVETPGKDYYNLIEYDGEKEIVLFPIASVRGIVKDSLDNIVGFADLKCACKTLPRIHYPAKTDKFGTFSTITPIGLCKIYANYENALGFEEITLEQGELKDIEIKLDKTIVTIPTKTYAGLGLGFLIAIIVIGVIIYFATRKKKRKEPEKRPAKRSEDIFKTLNAKEKEIVTCLQMNKGRTTQANIRHHTGIPRTSLSRLIKGLEDKNIVKVRKEGKAVKISLTDWFLEKA